MLRGKPFLVQSFADLDEFFRSIFDFMEALGRGGEVWKTHHIATIRKVRNRLSNISTRSKGLVTDDGAANDLEKATAMARDMVTRYGMSEKLGPLALVRHEMPVFLGRDFAERPELRAQTA